MRWPSTTSPARTQGPVPTAYDRARRVGTASPSASGRTGAPCTGVSRSRSGPAGVRTGSSVVTGPSARLSRSTSTNRPQRESPVEAKSRSAVSLERLSDFGIRRASPWMSGHRRGSPIALDTRTVPSVTPASSSQGTPLEPPPSRRTLAASVTPCGCSGLPRRSTATAPKATPRARPAANPDMWPAACATCFPGMGSS